jgi:hydrogenase/urease accessory protein HupE
MKTTRSRLTSFATGLWFLVPASLWAHEGHAGDHGWLAGATEPLLSLDHFLAGLFVSIAVSLGVTLVAERRQDLRAQSKP